MRDVDNEDRARARVSHLASRFPILRCLMMTKQVPGGMQSALSLARKGSLLICCARLWISSLFGSGSRDRSRGDW